MNQAGFLQDLFASIAERGRRLLDFGGEGDGSADLAELAEASGLNLDYEELDPDVFGGMLRTEAYREAERIAAVGAVLTAA